MPDHLLFDRGDEGRDLVRLALGLELHTSVGQIADEARDLETLRDLQCLVAEPDPLHPSGEMNDLVMHIGHRGMTESAARRFKSKPRKDRNFNCATSDPAHTPASVDSGAVLYMTNHDSDGMSDNDWEERRELSWTEADWEAYLAEHETAVRDYLNHYEQLAEAGDRIDEVARRMGWEIQADETALEETAEAPEPSFDEDFDLYTVHRNPVHIATKAIYLSLLANWERVAAHPERIHPAQALSLQGALFRGREHALQAVQSLDMGDYALAICFFKRALRELNLTLSLLGAAPETGGPLLARYREYAQPRLFDLREIWLRVMNECRAAESD